MNPKMTHRAEFDKGAKCEPKPEMKQMSKEPAMKAKMAEKGHK